VDVVEADIVDADDYDWSLPGGLREDGRDLNGGILIWHIDERLLLERLPTHSLNADPHRRAVDVEEADGSQDIGFPSGGLGPSFELGSPFDFFFKENDFTVVTGTGQEIILYQNRFGASTYPDSRSNSGGPSFVTLDDFSDTAPVMTFRFVRTAEENAEVLFSLSGAAQVMGEDASVILVGDDAYVYSGTDGLEDGVLNVWAGQEWRESVPASSRPAIREDLSVRQWRGQDGENVVVEVRSSAGGTVLPIEGLSVEAEAVSPVVLAPAGDRAYSLWRNPSGTRLLETNVIDGTFVLRDADDADDLVVDDAGGVLLIGASGVRALSGDALWTFFRSAEPGGRAAFGHGPRGLVGVVPDAPARRLFALSPAGIVTEIDLARYADAAADRAGAFPVLANLDGDAELEIVSSVGSVLLAFERSGAVVDGFPVQMPSPVVGQPLVLRRTTDDAALIVVGGDDGYLHAYDPGNRGRRVPGFPLPVGNAVGSTPFVGVGAVAVLSSGGDLIVWRTDSAVEPLWGQLYGSGDNRSYVAVSATGPETPAAQRILVVGETYNWPNPVRDGSTNLRVQLTREAHVEVRVVDMAGTLVAEFDLGSVEAFVPTERAWSTLAASGIYYARVKATDAAGNSDSIVVKIAVIR